MEGLLDPTLHFPSPPHIYTPREDHLLPVDPGTNGQRTWGISLGIWLFLFLTSRRDTKHTCLN